MNTMCALAPDIGALQAACSAFLNECRCPLCGLPWRKASTFPCGHTFCYDCAIATLEGPGISQSECPTCKGKYWKRDLKPNPQMMAVVEHTQKILSVAALQATAAAGHRSAGRGAASDRDQGCGNGARSAGGADHNVRAEPSPKANPSRGGQAGAWTGAAAPAAAGQVADGKACDGGPAGDSRLQQALPTEDAAEPSAHPASLNPHPVRLLRQPADAGPSGPEAAPALPFPALPSLARAKAAQVRPLGEASEQRGAAPWPQAAGQAGAPQPPRQLLLPEEAAAAAGAAHPAHRQEFRSATTACAPRAVVQPCAPVTLAALLLEDSGAERAALMAVALDPPRCNGPEPAVPGRFPALEQRHLTVTEQAGHLATPNAVAHGAVGARLDVTPPALQPLDLGHAPVGAGGAAHHAGELFLGQVRADGRHGYAPPSARDVLNAPPLAGAAATPFGGQGARLAACGSHPLVTVASAAVATPSAQLVPQPRSQAGAGWAMLSNGMPAVGTGCGRQLPGSVVSIRRGTPSANNAYLEFHSMLEYPVAWAGGPADQRPTGRSALDGLGAVDRGGGEACGGWEPFQEASWLGRLMQLPGPTEQEREALAFELSVVGMFMEELQTTMAELQGSEGVIATAAGGMATGQEACVLGPQAGRGAEGTGLQQEDTACAAGDAGPVDGPLQVGGQGAAAAPPPHAPGMDRPAVAPASPPPLQEQQQESPQEHGIQVACAGSPSGAAAGLSAANCEALSSHHGAVAAGACGNGAASEGNGGREQPPSGCGAGGSWELGGDRARNTCARLGAPQPACDLPMRCAPGETVHENSDEDAGRQARRKRVRMEAVGPGLVLLPPPAPPPARRALPHLAQAVAYPEEEEEDMQVTTAAGPPLKSLEPDTLAAAQPVGSIPGHINGGGTGPPARGGEGAAGLVCPAAAAPSIDMVRAEAQPIASALHAPGSPPAVRAPSPAPRHRRELEHQTGAHTKTCRRRDRAQVNKRQRSEPLQPPLEPVSRNPPAPPRRAKARERGSAAAMAVPALGAELAAPGPAGRRAKPAYVLSTALGSEDRTRLQQLPRRLRGLELLSDVQPQLTHLVVSLKTGQAARTMKYLRAVIQGCWVVGMEWVDACMAAGRLLPEGPFEATGDTVHPGTPTAARLRLERGEPPLFSGLRFCVMHLKGNFDKGFTKPELEALLQAAGGTLVRRPTHRAAGGGSAAAAPVTAAAALFGAAAALDLYDTSLCTQQQLTPQLLSEEKDAGGTPLPPGIPPVFVLVTKQTNLDTARVIREWGCAPVLTTWVYDSISHHKLLSPEAYKHSYEPHSSDTDAS